MSEAPRVFISYRREDTAGHAGRLYDSLAIKLGGDVNVFMDVDNIAPGLDFTEVLRDAVTQCDVMLALIGSRWTTSTAPDGSRRLDDPNDFVVNEIATALERDVRVIPVLIDGATMPETEQLPDRLKSLSHRNAMWLRSQTWRPDAESIFDVLAPDHATEPASMAAVPPVTVGAAPASPSVGVNRTPWLIAAGAVVVVILVAAFALTRDAGSGKGSVAAGAASEIQSDQPALVLDPDSGPIGTTIKVRPVAPCPQLPDGWDTPLIVVSLYDERAVATNGDGTINLQDYEIVEGERWTAELDVPADGKKGSIRMRAVCAGNDPDGNFNPFYTYLSAPFEITLS